MRRAAPALLATLLGLVLLLQFRTTPAQTVVAAPAPTVPSPTSPSTPTTVPSGAPPTGGGSGGGFTFPPATSPLPTTPPTSPPTTAKPSGSSATRVVDGPAESNRYGTVQVEVTLSGSQITDVEALQLPNERARSASISSFAGPRLRQEALQAQSARINTVSGATYTSVSYRASLQAALDQAGA